MVVPVSQDFTRALTEPLEVIQELFASEEDKDAFPRRVHSHFNTLFDDDATRSKVPFLTQSAASGSSSSTRLLRWRCMIQDTSLGNEVLPRQIRTADGVVHNGLFGASSKHPAASEQAIDNPSEGGFSSLTTMCGVSLPGQSQWSREEDGDGAGLDRGTFPGALTDKLPRQEEGMGVLLKVYDEQLAESLHVAQVVDVLGVLDNSQLPAADWTQMGARNVDQGTSRDVATASSYPTLHVISFKGSPTAGVSTVDARARAAIIDLVANEALGGDRLAAEWVLLATLARIHTRTAAQSLGSLALNLSGFPANSTDGSGPLLLEIMRSLLPLVAEQSLALSHLNAPSTRFAPKSDADERGLLAGRLQLVKGTLLFIDEGTMNEGQLMDNGIANIKALSDLLGTHKLAYVFPFSSHEMDSDLPCIVISQGKSFLPLDVHVPLQTEQQASLYGKDLTADEEKLRPLRRYLAAAAKNAELASAFSIPTEVSERIQDDFVETRKTNQQPNSASNSKLMDSQEDLVRLIQVARLICISNGRQSLQWDDWQSAKGLEAARQARLAESVKV